MRKLTHEELLKRQREQAPPPLSLCAVVNNVRSLYNVGSLFRTADAAGVEKLWLCGITGIPPSNKISKTALDAEKAVAWEYRRQAGPLLAELKEQGYEIVLLEQTVHSVPYQSYTPKGPVCLVIGNEVSGVDEDLLALCDRAVEIEMTGLKNSLNVTVAFGIAVYHLRQCLVKPVAGG